MRNRIKIVAYSSLTLLLTLVGFQNCAKENSNTSPSLAVTTTTTPAGTSTILPPQVKLEQLSLMKSSDHSLITGDQIDFNTPYVFGFLEAVPDGTTMDAVFLPDRSVGVCATNRYGTSKVQFESSCSKAGVIVFQLTIHQPGYADLLGEATLTVRAPVVVATKKAVPFNLSSAVGAIASLTPAQISYATVNRTTGKLLNPEFKLNVSSTAKCILSPTASVSPTVANLTIRSISCGPGTVVIDASEANFDNTQESFVFPKPTNLATYFPGLATGKLVLKGTPAKASIYTNYLASYTGLFKSYGFIIKSQNGPKCVPSNSDPTGALGSVRLDCQGSGGKIIVTAGIEWWDGTTSRQDFPLTVSLAP